MRRTTAIALALFSLAHVSVAQQREESSARLERQFQAGDVQQYRVELTVRSEVEGYRPARVGIQTYAEPFSDAAEVRVSWHATRRILAMDADGAADVEETLDDFSGAELAGLNECEGPDDLQNVLRQAVNAWIQQPKVLRYRETKRGQIVMTLNADAAPALDDAPAVLTLWLRRALRPTAPLPDRSAREGDRWHEPRAVRLPPWTDVQGTESGEWLAGPLPERSLVKLINLHVVQQISGAVPAEHATGSQGSGQAQGRFHAESLAALVHLGTPLHGGYGSLHSATRSATREITRVVEGVERMPEPPVFRARLSAEVRIQVIE